MSVDSKSSINSFLRHQRPLLRKDSSFVRTVVDGDGYIKIPLADLLEVTKVIRPKRDVVNKENPIKLDEVLDPIPQRHKLKRHKKSKYDELAKRLDEEPQGDGEKPDGLA